VSKKTIKKYSYQQRRLVMPTIVFVSPKGGAGKTTSALVLASQLAKKTKVTVIDADPNHPIATWATGANKPANLTVISDTDEETIADRIDEAAAETPFVIVDLEGTASKIVVMAVSRADYVIVPTQGSELDAEQAGKALNVIRQHEKSMRRADPDYVLPYSVLLTYAVNQRVERVKPQAVFYSTVA